MIKRLFNSRRWVAVCAVASLLVTACATSQTQRDLEYGKALMASGRLNDAYVTLQKAAKDEPSDAEVRIAYLSARDRLGNFLIAEGDQAMQQKHWSDAEQFYLQASKVADFDSRAQSSLKALAAARGSSPATPPTAVVVTTPAVVTTTPSTVTVVTPPPAAQNVDAGQKPLTITETMATAKPVPVRVEPLQPAIVKDVANAVAAPPAPAAAAPAPSSVMAQAMQKHITLQFRDTTVRSLFDIISKTSGLNVIIDKDVPGDQKTTVYLNNTTIEGAIQKILLTNQLAYRALDDNTLLIYQDVTAKQRDYQSLVVRSFLLGNADAKVVGNTLKTILKFRDVVIDDKLNMIIVRDTPEAIRQAEKIIALQDVPEPEVMLDVDVAEVSRTLLKDLGIDWPGQLSLTPIPSQTSTAGVQTTDPATGAVTTSGGTTVQLTLNDILHLNANNLGASIGSLNINAHRNDGDVNTLANPRIRVKNKEKAKILIGQRVPNVTATTTSTGVVGDSINYVDVGLTLQVEPEVFADGEVVIKISLEVSNILDSITTKSGTVAYRLGTRTASTVLRLKDNENQILAGLIEDDDRSTNSVIPGLGDIPILGRLFGSKHDDKSKSEIVLSITPHLIRGITRPPKDAAEFDAGTVSSIRGRRDASEDNVPISPIVQPAPDDQTQPPQPQQPSNGPRTPSRSD